ncbi:MAG TPA: glycoside hydrolase family 9 protein [Candidatus Hydrogenedentes bacterium]|jgi:hypothetical protein|nr:MAG: Glycosyl hydrolase family 9 [Candidatus Hydrogenedentes bacterium ADurb.Bin170]HQB02591.1 glycoside hydrolase family 9 protein [Candidatus Hydrogenedentota bacterium]
MAKNKSCFFLTALFLLAAPMLAYSTEGEEDGTLLDTTADLLNISSPSFAAAQGAFKLWKQGKASDPVHVWLDALEISESDALQPNEDGSLTMPPDTVWVSESFPVDANTSFLSGAVLGDGSERVSVSLLWLSKQTVLKQDTFLRLELQKDQHFRFNLAEMEVPENADAVRLALCNQDSGQPARWHSILLNAALSYTPEITLTASRLGYEPEWPKTFSVHTNFRASQATFVIKDDTDKKCFQGQLSGAELITGHGGVPWPGYYYQGDFSDFQDEGVFTIEVQCDQCEPVSREIFIRYQVLWNRAFLPALLPFKAMRSEENNPDGHLHLWNETGENPATDGELLWNLARSWSFLYVRFADSPVLTALEEEVFYGAEKTADYVLGKSPLLSDEPHVQNRFLNALTCIARTGRGSDTILKAACLMMEKQLESSPSDPWTFYAALDLYVATQEERYFEYAAAHVPGITLDRVESMLTYESLSADTVSPFAREQFGKSADILLQSAKNAYDLPQGTQPHEAGFFLLEKEGAQICRGNTVRVLSAAEIAAQAYRYTADRRYLRFVCSQFNWIWGNNPMDACLVADAGEKEFLIPGAVMHGIGPVNAQTDIPAFPETGEKDWKAYRGFSLNNNASYIVALSHLLRIPTVPPKK